MNRGILRCGIAALLLMAGLAGQATAGLVVGMGYAEAWYGYVAAKKGAGEDFIRSGDQLFRSGYLSDGFLVNQDFRIEKGEASLSSHNYGRLQGLEENEFVGEPRAELGFDLSMSSASATGQAGLAVFTRNDMTITSSFQASHTQWYDLSAAVSATSSTVGDPDPSLRGTAGFAWITLNEGPPGDALVDFKVTSQDGDPAMTASRESRVLLTAGLTYSLNVGIFSGAAAGNLSFRDDFGPESAYGAAMARLQLVAVADPTLVTPEPTGFTMLATCCLGLLGYARRRKAATV